MTKILIHLIFSTKERSPFLSEDGLRIELNRYITGIYHQQQCHALQIGGVSDHIHCLCQWHSTSTVSALADEYREFLRRYDVAFDERYVWA